MRYMRTLVRMLVFQVGILITSVGSAQLQVGDLVPDFKALDDEGQIWDSRDHIGKKPIVVFFYASDFAFCCTRQAVRYRESQRDLARLDVEIVGVSGDVVAAHRLFKTTHALNFPLLADFEGNVARKFEVALRQGGKVMVKDASGEQMVDADGAAICIRRDVTAVRTTFVIGKDGRIIYRNASVSPLKDSQDVLNFLR